MYTYPSGGPMASGASWFLSYTTEIPALEPRLLGLVGRVFTCWAIRWPSKTISKEKELSDQCEVLLKREYIHSDEGC